MVTVRNPLDLFLPTHPRRGFREDDLVLHNGQGASYRGCVGRIRRIINQFGHCKIIVGYDNAYRDEVDYNVAWALENLLVCCVDLMEKPCGPAFNQEYYVGKYYREAVTAAEVAGLGKKHPISHAGLKQLVDTAVPGPKRRSHALTGMHLYHTDKIGAEQALKEQIRTILKAPTSAYLQMELQMSPIHVEMPQPTAVEIDLHSAATKYLVLEMVEQAAVRIVAREMTIKEIEQLPVGQYKIYKLANDLVVKPKTQTELVWS